MAPVYLESAHAYASHAGGWQPRVPLERSPCGTSLSSGYAERVALLPARSDLVGGLSFASLLSVNLLSAAHEWRRAPDALRLPRRPSQSRLSPSWSPRSLPPNFSPSDGWTLSRSRGGCGDCSHQHPHSPRKP